MNSSRMVAQGIALNDDQYEELEFSGNSMTQGSHNGSALADQSPLPESNRSTALSRLKGRVHALWLSLLRKCPLVTFKFPIILLLVVDNRNYWI